MSFRLKLAGIEQLYFCTFHLKNSCPSPTRGAKKPVLHPEQTTEDGRWQCGHGIANADANVYF